MSLRSGLALFFGVVLAFMLFQPAARADEWNEMTKLKFNQPVELPHVVLPAGSYWFILANSASDRDIVEVFSENWKVELATLFTVPTSRQQSADYTVLKFAERPHNQPEALLKWYYPGRLTGHEFLYSTRNEHRFAGDPKQTVEAHSFSSRSLTAVLEY
jgi:hypothetical protein